MTDTSSTTPSTTPLKAMDAVAESMIVKATVDEAPVKRKKKANKIAEVTPSDRDGSDVSTVTAHQAPDGASGPDDTASQSAEEAPYSLLIADELVEAREESPEDLDVAEEAPDPDASEEGEETSFDEWADYSDSSRKAGADDSPDDESGGREAQPLELADDARISVTVDGESQIATIAELKKRYAGEGAIEKRLQEATELRKVAVQQVAHNRDKLVEVLNAVGGILFTPTTKAPDPTLARSDPGAFLEQQTLHQNEVAMLANRKEKLQSALVEADQEVAKSKTAMRQDEAAKLRVALPVLNDPVRGPKVQKAILSAAKEIYGFSDVDIAAAADHRIFVVMADAMRYRKLIAKNKARPVSTDPRTIRPSGGSNKPRESGLVKREKAVFKRARASGKAEDIAATMIVRKPRRGHRN